MRCGTLQLSHTGSWVWGVDVGGEGAEKAAGVAMDTSGRVYVTGTVAGPTTIRFGLNTLVHNTSDPDMLLMQVSKRGYGAKRVSYFLDNKENRNIEKSNTNSKILSSFDVQSRLMRT